MYVKEKEASSSSTLEIKIRRRRAELFKYKLGQKTRIDCLRDLAIDDVTQLRIGVFGPCGSGKSSFISTCERTVRETERGTAYVESSSGQEGTLTLRDYLPEMFFRLVDTRCFFHYSTEEVEEFRKILEGKIRSGQKLVRSLSSQQASVPEMKLNPRPAFKDRLHGIIFVVMGNDPRPHEGALENYMRPYRDILKEMGNVCLEFLVMVSTFIDPVHKVKHPSSYANKIP